ncbi:MAG: fatty acid desaturase [Rhodospirillaceae bacterium]|nr:fatty acid desaturase [Rhodospirillaceae bacterium]MBT5677057.1 fatty acid desaturase [Rhodospirillaceae bacterium]MBT5779217.1 fatty acid desaturase [Rhodospirillaceae bacterium]MBT7293080.1 fatty acid desaturase [Rhodospirillaceae bacterium]
MDDVFADRLDPKTLKSLNTRSDVKGLIRWCSHLLTLGALAALISLIPFSPWLVPALVVYGGLLIFLFAPLHECIHRTAFRSRWLNDGVALLTGAVLILPSGYFREFHFAHHRHTQDPAQDPELASAKPASLGAYFWLLTGVPYWRERITTTLGHSFGRVDEAFIAPRKRPAIAREARSYLLIYAAAIAVSVAGESPAIVLYWLAPALLGQPALRLFLNAEHGNCPLTKDMLKNSRTTRSNAFVRWFAWNMPYHAEHHAYPGLPFHALPAAHQHLAPAIETQASGYLAVNWQLLATIIKRLS